MSEIGDALGTKIIDPQTLESLTKRIKHLIENPPMMSCVNVVLNETSALQHAVAKDLIMHCANVTEADANWYLLMKGVYSELQKLSVIGLTIDEKKKTEEI